jgi:hypothetical protein
VWHLAGGSSEVNKCPKSTTKIKEEMCIYLDRRKLKAIEREVDEEDTTEVQRRRSVIRTK